jgi:hypothetical protein
LSALVGLTLFVLWKRNRNRQLTAVVTAKEFTITPPGAGLSGGPGSPASPPPQASVRLDLDTSLVDDPQRQQAQGQRNQGGEEEEEEGKEKMEEETGPSEPNRMRLPISASHDLYKPLEIPGLKKGVR